MDHNHHQQHPIANKNNGVTGHEGHDMPKMSHQNHEAAMTDPQMAKQMEVEKPKTSFVHL